MKGVMKFGKKGKLSLELIKPFEILEKIGELAYRLALPQKVLEWKIKKLRAWRKPLVKILWKNYVIKGVSWELEEEIM